MKSILSRFGAISCNFLLTPVVQLPTELIFEVLRKRSNSYLKTIHLTCLHQKSHLTSPPPPAHCALPPPPFPNYKFLVLTQWLRTHDRLPIPFPLPRIHHNPHWLPMMAPYGNPLDPFSHPAVIAAVQTGWEASSGLIFRIVALRNPFFIRPT